MTSLPSYIDPEMWSAFVSQRQAMKGVPFTAQAQKVLVMKMMRAHGEGFDVNAALEKSVIYGYRSVFPEQRIATEKTAIDPALAKIDRDKLITKPPSDEIKAQIAKLKGRTFA